MSLRISVVIPAYNAGRWLGRTLESVLAQTFPAHDVVVVDDGSTDDTAAVAGRYAPRVKYVYQTNARVATARNRAAAESSGDWLAFLDADDEWFPEKLARQAALLDRNPELAWCCCNCVMSSRGVDSACDVPRRVSDELVHGEGLAYFEVAAAGLSLQTSGYLVRRDVHEEVGGSDTSLKLNEDRDLWWRIAMQYPRIGYVADRLYRYYIDIPNSITKGGPDRTGVLMNVCDNVRRARTHGPQTAQSFERYAQPLIADYLLRAAGGRASIRPDAMSEATTLLPLTARQRLLIAAVRALPAPVARRVANRLSH